MHTFAHRRSITILLSFSHICTLIITNNFLTVQFSLCLAYLLQKRRDCGAEEMARCLLEFSHANLTEQNNFVKY